MPPELAGEGAIAKENDLGPAFSIGGRSRRFSNVGLSIFQSKRFASSNGAKHRRGSSLDSSAACLGSGSSHWQYKLRDAPLCEPPLESTQCQQHSIRRRGEVQTVGPLILDIGEEPDRDQQQRKRQTNARSEDQKHQPKRKASRWMRIVGRFGGKNRVREESSAQAKDHVFLVQGFHKPGVKKVVEASRSGKPPEARKGAKKYKWVSCEDLSRVSSQRDKRKEINSSRHYELPKPVLEPVQFATSDSSNDPEVTISAVRSKPSHLVTDSANALGGSQTRKELLFLPSRSISDECKSVVTDLRCKKGKEQGVVAAEARLLAKDYPTARATLAALGAIAPLVSMLDSASSFCAHTALLALYTLAIGDDVNKAAIVDAGAIPKMLILFQNSEFAMQEAVAANLLSLSAFDRNKHVIASCGAVAHLVHGVKQGGNQIRRESLRALYNLSLAQCNIKLFVEADATVVVMEILKTVNADATGAEKALAVVGNMVAAPLGRRSVTEMADAVEILVGVLGWGVQFFKCQERAAYTLMVIAHHSFGHRQAMVEKRAIPALLEVSLMGSALAQKRAVQILECLREDREQGRPMSAPMGPPRKARYYDSIPAEHEVKVCEGSKIVNHMVQQSLEENLRRIVRRAKLPVSMDHMRASSLSGCSSSKSLPF